MTLEEGEYVHLNLKRFTKQLLKIMVNSNIEYCEQNEEDEMLYKYKDIFASFLSKHRVYSATFRNLHKNIEYLVKHISKQMQKKKKKKTIKKVVLVGNICTIKHILPTNT